jgi:hypothetical protein
VAYVLAVIMPVILLAVMAAPLGLAWTISRLRQPPSTVTTPPPLDPNATDGEPGLGDPYFPQAGNSGYDVIKYQIMINWDPRTQTITGTTTISARATQHLNSFYFDLALAHRQSQRQWGTRGIHCERLFRRLYQARTADRGE